MPSIYRHTMVKISGRSRYISARTISPGFCVDGIFLSDFEQGEMGPDLFRHACLMGLEGLVSKHRDRSYRGGRSPHWIKVKNRSITRLTG